MMSGYYPNYPPSHGMHEGGAGSNPPPPGFVYGQQQQPSMQQQQTMQPGPSMQQYGSHQFEGAAPGQQFQHGQPLPPQPQVFMDPTTRQIYMLDPSSGMVMPYQPHMFQGQYEGPPGSHIPQPGQGPGFAPPYGPGQGSGPQQGNQEDAPPPYSSKSLSCTGSTKVVHALLTYCLECQFQVY